MRLRRCYILVVLSLVVCFAPSAFAQEADDSKAALADLVTGWEATFRSSAVDSYVQKDGMKYIVVAAGESSESTEKAAEALAKALRNGKASVVMNDDALGEVAGLDDDKILAKAKALPVDQIVIVRVFPGGEGKPDRVVVTVRDNAGEAVWALSGTRGTPVEAKESEGGGMGVSRSAAEAVGQTVESESEASNEAQEEYAKRFIWFQSMVGVNQYGAVVSSWSNVYQGKYMKPLEPEAFYRQVGRADLADEYAANSSQAGWASAAGAIGVLGLIGGGTWWFVEWATTFEGEPDTTVPMWVTIGGGAMMIGGVIAAPDEIHPVEPSEARELADKHNQTLKEELGLSKDYSPMPQASRNSIKYNFGIGAAPGGAAGVLRVEF